MSLLEPPTAVQARASRKGMVRPMIGADVPAVARLFLKIFRGADKPADQELQHYLCTLALTSPAYDETLGTQVYQQQDGRIRSALLAVPMRFVACGDVLPGRLLGVFMADAEAAGAAQLILALRPRRADFAFCDSASPTSRDHLLAIGGRPVPVQNLEWVRSFRPVGALVGRFAERFLGGRRLGLSVLTRPLDELLRRRSREQGVTEPGSAEVVEMPVRDFLVQAPRLVAHYAVHPLWSEEELSWLVALAAQNTRLGAFTIRAVIDRTGAVIGSFVYYAASGGSAHVLNVLSLPGQEQAVLGAMFRHLDETGHVEARGRAQFALMAGLSLQRWLVFRHRAFTVALTRVPEINDAVARGDVYVGGLAGEDWSRLLGDFN
ncbi:MAG: GNAT family N-acetyltransferase [Bosea sp.]|uniref:GNAT family N-acetyltransferase n=1 Tax=Bosea sp. (in: a-proteobacteria) TaxID=1871050 RepID=UPI0023A31718|nr:GNAT family N-acetyltransferase [Bosea sp. (in: a-proteobacteria)]MCP4739545.1 GNAT family N-acetyltransferase [Bosea sp. (in: a-proteobacteria)]